MNDRQKVIDIALAEIGYLEKASNANLDDPTANAGSANFTKYARDLDNISGFYNGKKNGFAWCDVFVDWCFVKAFGVEQAKKLLCQPNNSLGAGCTFSAQYYRSKGQFFTKDPQPGDQIFFGSAAESTHTGIVYAVDSSKVYTVEGNTSGASGVISNGGGVCKKSYSLTSSWIYGYGRPKYDSDESSTQKPISSTTSTETVEKVNTCQVQMKVLKKGMNGIQVEMMQVALIRHGFAVGSDGADGDFGGNTEKALKEFQEANDLVADCICGQLTWGKLCS